MFDGLGFSIFPIVDVHFSGRPFDLGLYSSKVVAYPVTADNMNFFSMSLCQNKFDTPTVAKIQITP